MNNSVEADPEVAQVSENSLHAITTPDIVPVSAILPTRNRPEVLRRMLLSLARQSLQPAEMIVVDSSTDKQTEQLCSNAISGLNTKIVYKKAIEMGAATQRNQAMTYVTQKTIWLLEDDVILEEDCLANLWAALESNPKLGGVSAMIINQRYASPGRVSRTLFRLLHGQKAESYAGKCIGPAFNILPEDNSKLPRVVEVEWLNAGCTLYRSDAVPRPLFDRHFTGYSLMEDLALSLKVAEKWKLANARTARIYHDSQPADYKSNAAALAKMELINRHYVMTQVMRRNEIKYYLKLALLEMFGIVTPLVSGRAWKSLPSVLLGKLAAIRVIMTTKYPSQA
jgi:GT2 family glycosyltransferase